MNSKRIFILNFLRHHLFIAFFIVVLIGCQKDTNEDNSSLPEQTQLNVAYGADPLQKMDIYLPADRNSSSTKVIITIHGGAWAQGDKSDFAPYIDTLKRRLPGYAIININYRLSNGTTVFFPAQENDVKAALEFIYSKRSEFNISDKFALLGASAGGHLALLQSYKYSSPVKIKAVVDFFGPTDMTDLYNNPASILVPSSTIALIVGATPTTNPAIYQQSSPVNFVNAQSPPTIILHGGLDPVVSPNQSIALKNLLQTAGVTHEYVFYATELHGWTGANLADSFDKITAFLNANVN
ncbi:MAG TPA: alpha/beta hydrolase [Chitinophagaceae bacterium]|nr:alpha/beta hydrolase [Chitinophagaceae bacterium]